jgi:hypothetical protein
MWNIDLKQIQAILRKTGHTEGRSHKRERGQKRKLRKIWLLYFLFKNEHRIFKSVEITKRRGLRQKGEK